MTRVLLVLAIVGVVAVIGALYRRSHARHAARPIAAPPFEAEITAGAERTWVVFTTKYCATCEPTIDRLRSDDPDARLVKLDVADRPDLARRYDVRSAPTVLLAAADGTVLSRQ